MVHSNVQMMIHTPKKNAKFNLIPIQETGQSMPMVANMQIRPCFNSTALRRSKSSLVQSPEAVEFSVDQKNNDDGKGHGPRCLRSSQWGPRKGVDHRHQSPRFVQKNDFLTDVFVRCSLVI